MHMEYDRSLSDVWKNTDPAGIFLFSERIYS